MNNEEAIATLRRLTTEDKEEILEEAKTGSMVKAGGDLSLLEAERQKFIESGGDPSQFQPSNGLITVVGDHVIK